MNLNTSVEEITGIGPSSAEKLLKLGIKTIEDLLMYLPRRWDDYSKVVTISQIRPEETISIHGKIWQITSRRSKGGRSVTEVIINDGTGSVKAVWFNQPFLINNLHEGEEIYLAGKVEWNNNGFSFISPSYEKVSDEEETMIHTARIVPVYPETEGVTSKWLRGKIKLMMRYIYSIKDYLPNEIKEEQNLLDLAAAVRQMHFPEDEALLKKAKDRLDFDEMFLIQLAVLNSKKHLEKEKAISVPFNEELIKKFVQSLGFDLTTAQRKSAWEIIQAMGKPYPMNRLLQGDVGSGKTAVAALVMANVAASGSQSVLLCPTEILAKQHFEKIKSLLGPLGFEVEILTGSTPKQAKEEIASRLKDGELKVLIGTHAVLEKNIEFWRLALAIVDEQHRFGVGQRNDLRKESKNTGTMPHFLSMTATPIPRTLTLTLYGDLEVSVLDEMPKGRQKIITKLVPQNTRTDTYKFIENELKNGRQAFVVCPLIGEEGEDRDENEKKSVMSEFENIKKIFTDFSVNYLHGRMSAVEKEKTMADFLENKTQILVSTSVIEVGVDVPNASIMIIEDADRFGLAQLHQFRGRVGRGQYQSYCFLFTNSKTEETTKRLQAIANTTDGFKLADIDLEIRGPGDFIGARQHGMPDIKMKNLLNVVLIKKCRDSATKFLEKHNLEEYPLLVEKTGKFEGVLHLE